MVRAVPGWLRWSAWVFVLATGVFMLAPLIVVIGASVSESQFVSFPPKGFSLRWYQNALSSPAYLNAFWLSLGLGVLVTVSATIIGGAAAVGDRRASCRERVLLWVVGV